MDSVLECFGGKPGLGMVLVPEPFGGKFEGSVGRLAMAQHSVL